MSVSETIVDIISTQKQKEDINDIWENSPYKDLIKLQSNNVGVVGETFIQHLCKISNIHSAIDGSKTKKTGCDGFIFNKKVEIKTAVQGRITGSFQHELGECPWLAEYMIFLDISPQCLYLTIFPNFTEEHYKSGNKCAPIFPSRRITWRKKTGAFKLVTTNAINAAAATAEETPKYTIIIQETTQFHEVGDFICYHLGGGAPAPAHAENIAEI